MSDQPDPVKGMSNDLETLHDLIADHGEEWVARLLSPVTMVNELQERDVDLRDWWIDGVALELEYMGFPEPLVKAVKEYQQCPWLCPVPEVTP